MRKQTALAVLALLVSILSWGSVPLFLKHFTAYLDAWTVNGMRYAFAALLLLPALRGRGGEGKSVWRAALLPSLVNTIGQVGWALLPYFLTASVMGFGVRASFLFTLAVSPWLLPEERYLYRSRAFWAGGTICVAGVVALFWGSIRQASASTPGLIILLGAAAVWGLYGVTVRKYMRGYAPHRGFATISLYTAGIVSILMLLFGRISALAELSSGELGLLGLSAVLGIALAHVMMFYVLNHLGPVIEGGAEMLTPFLTFGGAALIFGERMTPLQWAGGVSVVAGCVFMIAAHRPQPEVAASTDALGLD